MGPYLDSSMLVATGMKRLQERYTGIILSLTSFNWQWNHAADITIAVTFLTAWLTVQLHGVFTLISDVR